MLSLYIAWREFTMLVLSRKAGQRIQIAGNITITVLESRGSVVKLGIEAPREVSIVRDEVSRRPTPYRDTEPCFELMCVG